MVLFIEATMAPDAEPWDMVTVLPDSPTLSFTLPSIHDGLPLDCRVYHPWSLYTDLRREPPTQEWRKHAAVVAHPYAPLGGCYNDPVVGIVGRVLLDLGYLVMTFNFRGARGSAGRTSWTAKAERADYMSAVGFLSYYAHFLDPFSRSAPDDDELTGETPAPDIPVLLMAGYSYGSMITTQLPPLPTILGKFDAPLCHSHAADIRLRAQHLAEDLTKIIRSIHAAASDPQSGRSRKSLGLRVGGEEEIRPSHEYKRGLSFDVEDKIRKGVADLMAKAKQGHKKDERQESLLPIPGGIPANPAYLLISPLQGPIKNLACMSFLAGFARSSRKPSETSPAPKSGVPDSQGQLSESHAQADASVLDEAEDKLTQNPTFAIYGDKDTFVPVRKIRNWASRLESVPGSRLRATEVSGATHFWIPKKDHYTMRNAVRTFAGGLLEETGSV